MDGKERGLFLFFIIWIYNIAAIIMYSYYIVCVVVLYGWYTYTTTIQATHVVSFIFLFDLLYISHLYCLALHVKKKWVLIYSFLSFWREWEWVSEWVSERGINTGETNGFPLILFSSFFLLCEADLFGGGAPSLVLRLWTLRSWSKRWRTRWTLWKRSVRRQKST